MDRRRRPPRHSRAAGALCHHAAISPGRSGAAAPKASCLPSNNLARTRSSTMKAKCTFRPPQQSATAGTASRFPPPRRFFPAPRTRLGTGNPARHPARRPGRRSVRPSRQCNRSQAGTSRTRRSPRRGIGSRRKWRSGSLPAGSGVISEPAQIDPTRPSDRPGQGQQPPGESARLHRPRAENCHVPQAGRGNRLP